MKIKFDELEKHELVLLIIPKEKVDDINMGMLEHFVNKKKSVCIYTTFTKPYKVLLKNLKKESIDSDKIFFIDCATPVSEAEEIVGNSKVIFCEPQSLTNLSISITTALKNMSREEDRVLILDTITTLMLYNDKNDVIKFIHHICGQIRKYDVRSLIFTLDEESDKKIISEVSRFCDASFTLSQLMK